MSKKMNIWSNFQQVKLTKISELSHAEHTKLRDHDIILQKKVHKKRWNHVGPNYERTQGVLNIYPADSLFVKRKIRIALTTDGT